MNYLRHSRVIVAFAAIWLPTLLAAQSFFYAVQSPEQILRYDAMTGRFKNTCASGSYLADPLGMTFGPDGDIYVASGSGNRILRFNGGSGQFKSIFATNAPQAINLTFGPDGNLYVSCSYSEIRRFDGKTGQFIDVFISDERLAYPRGLQFGSDGNLYIVSYNSGKVLRYSGADGTFLGVFVDGLFTPSDLKFGPDGNLYVTSGSINRYNGTNGTFIDQFASPPHGYPFDIAFGPDGNLYATAQGDFDGVLRFDGQTGAYLDDFIVTRTNASGAFGLTFGPPRFTSSELEKLVPCEGPASGGFWKNHGTYVATVVHTVREMQRIHRLTEREANHLIWVAIVSDCGKPHLN